MPRSGFKSITLRENIYDYYLDFYLRNKNQLQLVGVNSFTGFMTWIYELLMKDNNVKKVVQMNIYKRIEKILN